MRKLYKKASDIDRLLSTLEPIMSNEVLFVFGAGLNINLTENSLSWNEFNEKLFKDSKINYGDLIKNEKFSTFHPKVIAEVAEKSIRKKFKQIKLVQNEEQELFSDNLKSFLDIGKVDIMTTNFELPEALKNRESYSHDISKWDPLKLSLNLYIHGSFSEEELINSASNYKKEYFYNFENRVRYLTNFFEKKNYKRIFIFGMSGRDDDFLQLISEATKNINNLHDEIFFISTDFDSHIRNRNFFFQIMKTNYKFNTIFITKEIFNISLEKFVSHIVTNNIISNKTLGNIKMQEMNKKIKDGKLKREKKNIIFENWNKWTEGEVGVNFALNKILEINTKVHASDFEHLKDWSKWIISKWIIKQKVFYKNELPILIKNIMNYGSQYNLLKYISPYFNDISNALIDKMIHKSLENNSIIYMNLKAFIRNYKAIESSTFISQIIFADLEKIKLNDLNKVFKIMAKNDKFNMNYLNYETSLINKYIKEILNRFNNSELKTWVSATKDINIWKYKIQATLSLYKMSKNKIFLEDFGFKHNILYVNELDFILPNRFNLIFLKENKGFKKANYIALLEDVKCEDNIDIILEEDRRNKEIYKKWFMEICQGNKITINHFYRNNYILKTNSNEIKWEDIIRRPFHFREFYNQWKSKEINPENIEAEVIEMFIDINSLRKDLNKLEKILNILVKKKLNDNTIKWFIFTNAINSRIILNNDWKKLINMARALDGDINLENHKSPFMHMINTAIGGVIKNIYKNKNVIWKDEIKTIKSFFRNEEQILIFSYYFIHFYKEQGVINDILESENSWYYQEIILWRANISNKKILKLFIQAYEKNKEKIIAYDMQNGIAQSLLFNYYFSETDIPLWLTKNKIIKFIFMKQFIDFIESEDVDAINYGWRQIDNFLKNNIFTLSEIREIINKTIEKNKDFNEKLLLILNQILDKILKIFREDDNYKFELKIKFAIFLDINIQDSKFKRELKSIILNNLNVNNIYIHKKDKLITAYPSHEYIKIIKRKFLG